MPLSLVFFWEARTTTATTDSMATSELIESFISESNRIEGIHRVTEAEIVSMHTFLDLEYIKVDDLVFFVNVYQPGAHLRLNGEMVRIGNHVPPTGGQAILYHLESCLHVANNESVTPYEAHIEYEILHPFTDCNGRSGRALWLWMMTRGGSDVPLGFLHTFYYQSLDKEARK